MIVESLEDAEDVMGEVSINDITDCLPKAARALVRKRVDEEDTRTSRG